MENLSKIKISDDDPLRTVDFRENEIFITADPAGEVPDVILGSGVINPHDRVRPNVDRIGIADMGGTAVGAFNLKQGPERSWINDVRIELGRRGEYLAVATYLGVIAELQTVGRTLESDPGGLSDDSLRLWESLSRRGVARAVEGSIDQHGNPRYVAVQSIRP